MSLHDKVNDPKYITVCTQERFFKPVARLVTKKTLRKIVSEQCDDYKKGLCHDCFTEKQELETPCTLAWELTIGKGKKLY
ncbi:hypothetical protein G3M81_22915 [Bacillus paralicheniformis]|uniref:hypothetical protein n=1 Tax=Bacillus TaxID=1386 RepID=UPI0013EE6BE0|nr:MULTISPECIES: hypothetical protein [Bacillus]MCJ8223661.1 hypothetical protein [Bacillus paralicheniformis]QII26943.1 hypothetical protein G3M80_20825 [Bacillus altitudinis]QII51411.1 hypothetical protein G3M81_22915 [Bacillus paralicheniformis]